MTGRLTRSDRVNSQSGWWLFQRHSPITIHKLPIFISHHTTPAISSNTYFILFASPSPVLYCIVCAMYALCLEKVMRLHYSST